MSFRPNWILFGLVGTILLAAGLRLWQIQGIPPGFHLDESYQGLEAWRILNEPSYHPFYLRGNFGPLPANTYLNVLTFWLFSLFGGESGPIAMRSTAAFIGLLTVIAMYGLASELCRYPWQINRYWFDSTMPNQGPSNRLFVFPLIAATILAVMRWHVHFSRMGIEPIYVPLMWTASAWLLLHGWRTGRLISFAASGMIVGAGMYTYRGAWVLPIVLALSILHMLIIRRQFDVSYGHEKTNRATIGIAVGLWAIVAFLVTSPLIYFYLQNPHLFFVRLEQVNIVGHTNSPADATIFDNVWSMARMFGPFDSSGDLDPRRNLPGTPALSWPLAIFFYIGIIFSLWRIRHPAYSLSVFGLIGLLLPGVFSEYAPHFHRVLGASAPTALLSAIGVCIIWNSSTYSFNPRSWRKFQSYGLRLSIIGLLLLGGILESYNYFGRWAKMSSLYHAFDAGIWTMGKVLASQSPQTPIYVTPRRIDHPTLAFALRRQAPNITIDECTPVSFDGRHVFPFNEHFTAHPELYAVIEHEDFRTRLLLPGVLPNATVSQELLDFDGNVYARFYKREELNQVSYNPQHSLDIVLGDGIKLRGYDVQPAELHPGETVYLQLHWSVERQPENDWTVFTHVRTRSPDSPQLVAGHDSIPGNGSLPTRCWSAGWRILDEYQITLPPTLSPGDYDLYTGMYQSNGVRLPPDTDGVYLGLVRVLEKS